jgi:hypothetical protein
MRYISIAVLALALVLHGGLTVYSQISGTPTGKSEWVSFNAQGKLVYKTTEKGDRITDSSHAGYMGGGVALPDVPVKKTVAPLANGADCTQLIQTALNEVAEMPPDAKGFRGAVLLEPGNYVITGTLTISVSGVVLRGSVDAKGTGTENDRLKSTLQMTQTVTPPRPYAAIRVAATDGQRSSGQRPAGSATGTPAETMMAEEYVPAGTNSFRVKNITGFQAGDRIDIRRPVTKEWIEFVAMHNLIRDGKPQTWLSVGTRISTERVITAIDGNKITVDVPLVDSYDPKYLRSLGTAVVKVTRPSPLVSQAGIECLRIVCPEQATGHGDNLYEAVRITGEDCWMRNVRIHETMNSVAAGGRRITIQFVDVIRKARHEGSSRPAEFAPNASQILLDRCTVEADNVWFVATGARVTGPIVILNCTFKGNSRSEGHQRWTTAVMFDGCVAPQGRMDIPNRGTAGSGHGWALAWSVLWNCESDILIQEPPGTRNWAIGNIGKRVPAGQMKEGTIDSHGTHVAPKSLYLAQLQERLGSQALKNIGY